MRLVRLFMLNKRIYTVADIIWPQVATSPLMLQIDPIRTSLHTFIPTIQRPVGLHMIKYCRHYYFTPSVNSDPYDHLLVIAANGDTGYIYVRRIILIFRVNEARWVLTHVRRKTGTHVAAHTQRPIYHVTHNKFIIDRTLRDAVYLIGRLAPELLNIFVLTAPE